MNSQRYYNFNEFEKITNNISNSFISALEAIIEISHQSPEVAVELFDISNYDLEQLKRLDPASAREIILSNPEIFAFNLTSMQINDARKNNFTSVQNFKGSEIQDKVERFYSAQANSILELISLIKAGGKDLANLLYQINEDTLDKLVTMSSYELYQLVEKIEYGIRLNEVYSKTPISDTIALLSSLSDKPQSIKTMLIDSVLNVKNKEDAQPDFQENLIKSKIFRETISFDKNIPENTSLVWAAHSATSTDKFIYSYLSSNFKKILKAKINFDKETGEDKIFPDDSIKNLGTIKSNSFSWYSDKNDQLKIYLLTSMYADVFNASFNRFPTLQEITILCFAFEIKYKLRNTYSSAMDLSYVHRIINNIPLIHGDMLEKNDERFIETKKLGEDPLPGLLKEPCEYCGTEIYIKRFKKNATKCVWCSNGIKKKPLNKLEPKENTKLKIRKISK